LKNSSFKEEIFHIFSNDYESEDVLNLSTKIERFFLNSEIPYEIVNEIKKAFKEIRKKLGKESSFSVRSSANIEDSNNFSFAGQAESYLNIINFSEILKSIKKCWSSLFSPKALLYLWQLRKNNKLISLNNIQMAVIIQKMIDSQISGVLFTVNVMNNAKNEMLINSTWGLGETITNGSVIPDLIILSKDKFSIKKYIIGEKEKTSIPNPEGNSTILIPTKQPLKEQHSLNKTELVKLYNLGLKLEKLFSYPQDIEWAIENDVIYTLQSRPITTLRK
ncbi:MAG: PEP/pyruvate-binding domain-containing protein, partial [Promethearchaeota archaeon]